MNCESWDQRGSIAGAELPQVVGDVIDQDRIVDCHLLFCRGAMMHTTESGHKQSLDSLFPPEFPQLLSKARNSAASKYVEEFSAYASEVESDDGETDESTEEDAQGTRSRPRRMPAEERTALPIMALPFHPFLGCWSNE